MDLQLLYDEYNTLKAKIDKVSELIVLYGGTIPASSTPIVLKSAKLPLSFSSHELANVTWKTRVEKVLQELGKPSTSKELIEYMQAAISDISPEKIHKAVTLYTSKMSRSGEIEVDRNSYPHRYYLKEK